MFGFGKQKEIKLRDILIQDYDKGGLRIIDFEIVIKASKLNWSKEYLKPTVNGTQKTCIPQHLIPKVKYDEMFTGISDEMWRNVFRLAKNVSIGHKIFEIQLRFYT